MFIDSAVRQIDDFEWPTSAGITLHRLTGGATTVEMIAERLFAEFEGNAEQACPDMLRKFEALGRLLYHCGPAEASLFERFIEIGSSQPGYRSVLEMLTVCEVDEWRLKPGPFETAAAEYRIGLRRAVETQALTLQRGENLGLQGELAAAYFGRYDGEQKV